VLGRDQTRQDAVRGDGERVALARANARVKPMIPDLLAI
jgi:hypothetical protein